MAPSKTAQLFVRAFHARGRGPPPKPGALLRELGVGVARKHGNRGRGLGRKIFFETIITNVGRGLEGCDGREYVWVTGRDGRAAIERTKAMTNELMTLESTQLVFQTKINGETVEVDFGKMHPTWIAAHLQKAAQRFLNDRYSGEKGAEKLAMVRADLNEIHKGEPMPEVVRQSRAPADPVEALAIKNAKTALGAMFQTLTGKRKIADFAAHEKAAPFFRETGGTLAWDEAHVSAWMAKQAENGKRDFRADAMATLNGVADLDDLDL